MERKLVVPGEYLASCEEALAGKNTITENDDIYAATFGELEMFGRMVQVKPSGKTFIPLKEGMEVHAIIEDILEPRAAFVTCMPIVKDDERSAPSFSAVLPVSNIRQGYVERMRDEVRVGDILKAKISKIDRTTVEISISDSGYGVVKGFCSRCRNNMVINENRFKCSNCGNAEARKLPFGQYVPRQRRTGDYNAGKRFKQR